MTKRQALLAASQAVQIIRQEVDGGLIEKVVSYEDMASELENYKRWFASQSQDKVYINVLAGFSFEVSTFEFAI